MYYISDYLLTRCKGLDLVSLFLYLEKHDYTEFRNLTGDIGIPLVSTPLLNRTPRKYRRTDCARDGFVRSNGQIVSASQPQAAKRK